MLFYDNILKCEIPEAEFMKPSCKQSGWSFCPSVNHIQVQPKNWTNVRTRYSTADSHQKLVQQSEWLALVITEFATGQQTGLSTPGY
jgi:hypothetical protein